MRLSQAPSSLLSLLWVLLSTRPVQAGPYPKDDLHDVGYNFLQDRSCYAYCGATNQYCCSIASEAACYTDAADVAYCTSGAASAGGSDYTVYTTTYTETDLVTKTSTGTSWYAAATTTAGGGSTGTPVCDTGDGQTSCGSICCASNQYCVESNQCGARTSGLTATTATTGTYSAPFRGTTGTTTTLTSTISATTTEPFGTPVAASGTTIPITSHSTSGGLSGGAIAGIVIGVILGILLLLLICFCCIVKAGFDGLLAIFGLGRNRRRTERTETVERYSRHSGTAGGSRRETHGGWFGGAASTRPSRVTETRKKSKTGGFGGLGALGAGLIGLAVMLGLRRKRDANKPKPRPAMTSISSDYYSDYTTTQSSASSDRRTRDTRRH